MSAHERWRGVRVVEEGEAEVQLYISHYLAEPPPKEPLSCGAILLSMVVMTLILSPVLLPGGGV